jgi:hypothetical protein
MTENDMATAYQVTIEEEGEEQEEDTNIKTNPWERNDESQHGMGSMSRRMQQYECVIVVTGDPTQIYEYFGPDRIQGIQKLGKGLHLGEYDVGVST